MTRMERILVGIALVVTVFLAGVLAAGCGDDKWTLISHCSTGQAQHVND